MVLLLWLRITSPFVVLRRTPTGRSVRTAVRTIREVGGEDLSCAPVYDGPFRTGKSACAFEAVIVTGS
jgi:hypothetical protein